MRLVLASASPRRAELLRAAGFAFDVVPAEVDERIRDGETPGDYVRRLAAEKSAVGWEVAARSFQDRRDRGAESRGAESPALQDLIVLGADTAVVVDGEIMGKPRDDREAAGMLRRLSGRRHEVMTGVSLRSRLAERGLVETTGVYMKELREQDIAWYLVSEEGRDKAGAYGIQGLASRFIPRIDGSYANVVGLPIANVALLLSELASAG
jgi:nucleoside triphosphate pyrophosphatase